MKGQLGGVVLPAVKVMHLTFTVSRSQPLTGAGYIVQGTARSVSLIIISRIFPSLCSLLIRLERC